MLPNLAAKATQYHKAGVMNSAGNFQLNHHGNLYVPHNAPHFQFIKICFWKTPYILKCEMYLGDLFGLEADQHPLTPKNAFHPC